MDLATAPVSSTRPTHRRWVRLVAAAVVAALIVAATVLLLARQYFGPKNAAPLTAAGSVQGSWWWPSSAAAEETVSVDDDGTPMHSIPMRQSQPQGIVMVVTNTSSYDKRVVGAVYQGFTVQLSVEPAAAQPIDTLAFADGVTIPPGGQRLLRVSTNPGFACGYTQGVGVVLSDVLLTVKSGWVTRTESILAPTRMELMATTDVPQAPTCGQGR